MTNLIGHQLPFVQLILLRITPQSMLQLMILERNNYIIYIHNIYILMLLPILLDGSALRSLSD